MKLKKTVFVLLALILLVTGACAEGRPGRKSDTKEDLSVAQGLDPDWMNVLLIGTDTREDELNRGRGDAIIVCSIHKKNGEIRLTSLARDMWVRIAGERFYDKINTAFRYGGPLTMMKTVNETLALNITNYVTVNFYGLCDLVDAIGGIELTLTRSERSVVNSSTQWKYGSVHGEKLPLGEGDKTVTLCGAQALAYARIRKLDNDLGRNRRQRNVIEAMIRKAMELPEGEMIMLGKKCFEHVSTNMSFIDMFSIAAAAIRGGMKDLQQLSLPSEGNYHFINENGKSALEFDLKQVQNEVHAFIYGEGIHKPEKERLNRLSLSALSGMVTPGLE